MSFAWSAEFTHRYSHAANGPDEKEEWIRKVPLLVLIYEGIVHNVYDYDYAPGVPNLP